MKKLTVIFLLFIAQVTYSQTIGDKLSYFKSEHPNGETSVNSNNITVFTIIAGPLYTCYYFDNDLICNWINIFPQTSDSRQELVNFFNNSWSVINPMLWRYYRGDGSILNCELVYDKEIGVLFKIYSIK